jgi:hypothetical protein
LLNLSGRRNITQLNTTGQQIETLLREAQSRSASGDSGATWGIYLANSTSSAPFYALYKNTYSPENTVGYYPLPSNVRFATSTIASGGSATITFAPVSGASSASATIALRLVPQGTLYTININSFGGVVNSTPMP